MDILAYVLAVVLFSVIMLLRQNRIRRGSFDTTIERLEKAGFSFDRKVFDTHNRFALLADTANKKWILLEQGKAHPVRPSEFETLLGYSLWEDNRLKQSGGTGFEQDSNLTGRALVKTQQNTCSRMEIRLCLAADYRPYVSLPLLEGETRKDSLTYETAMTVARETAAFLDEIIKERAYVAQRTI
jgi:hypothetical protein